MYAIYQIKFTKRKSQLLLLAFYLTCTNFKICYLFKAYHRYSYLRDNAYSPAVFYNVMSVPASHETQHLACPSDWHIKSIFVETNAEAKVFLSVPEKRKKN